MNDRAATARERAERDSTFLPTVSIAESIVLYEPAYDDPTETYHEASRFYPEVIDPTVRGIEQLLTSSEMRASAARSTKRFDAAPVVHLTAPALGEVSLAGALATRRSRRSLAPEQLTVAELATLLGAAYGVSGTGLGPAQALRTVPSGGALYPLELYVAPRRVEGLEDALFHYDPLRHVLERIRSLRADRELERLTPEPETIHDCAALIVMTGMFWRSRFKYGARAYRFTLVEAGHIAQNLLLAAAALDLAAVPIGGFYDRNVDSLVGADGLHEAALYLVPVGRHST